MKKIKKGKQSGLSMIDYCNTQISNGTEYSIAKAIIDSCKEERNITLEKLAEYAHVSEASVSRFIRKVGFSDYHEFQKMYLESIIQTAKEKQLFIINNYKGLDAEDIVGKLYQKSVDNMSSTLKQLDFEQLEVVAYRMKNAKSVSFYGESYTLPVFYHVQLDLIGMGVPSFLFEKREIQNIHLESLDEDDLIIYLNMFPSFIQQDQDKVLDNLHNQRKGYLIGFFPSNAVETAEELFDEVVKYGINDSYSDFYSLNFLSQILSGLLYI